MKNLRELMNEFATSDRILVNSESGITCREFHEHLMVAANQLPINDRVILFEEDPIYFLLLLLGLCLNKSNIVLVASSEIASELSQKEKLTIIDSQSVDWNAKASTFDLAFDQTLCLIHFYTSGSTGKAKLVAKSLQMILNEVKNLQNLWGDDFKHAVIKTSLSHFHYYGFLFTVFLPLFSEAQFAKQKVMYPEQLAEPFSLPWVFVSSPAFYKRCPIDIDLVTGFRAPMLSFSSGGFLDETLSRSFKKAYGTQLVEIYGSTETGGIAYKKRSEDPWTFFEGVNHSLSKEGTLIVSSNYFEANQEIDTNDLVAFEESKGFRLLGRNDSIVKVEEKRISTRYIEDLIGETGLVKDSKIVLDSSDRQRLIAFVVLDEQAIAKSGSKNKKDLVTTLRTNLSSKIDPIVIPKKWRFVPAFEYSSLGKIQAEPLLNLLDAETYAGQNPIVLSKKQVGQRLEFVLEFDQSYKYFRGHFESFKILPAVAQVDLVMHFAREHFGAPFFASQLPRIKFQSPVKPGTLIALNISYDQNSVAFEFKSLLSGKPCSSGKIKIGGLHE